MRKSQSKNSHNISSSSLRQKTPSKSLNFQTVEPKQSQLESKLNQSLLSNSRHTTINTIKDTDLDDFHISRQSINSTSVVLGAEPARCRFEQMTKAISDKKSSKLNQLFNEIYHTVPDLYDQQSLKLLFDYLMSLKTSSQKCEE